MYVMKQIFISRQDDESWFVHYFIVVVILYYSFSAVKVI